MWYVEGDFRQDIRARPKGIDLAFQVTYDDRWVLPELCLARMANLGDAAVPVARLLGALV